MYLHSLELFGFKSFAARTTLNFHRGVTAIVGPNGCGKSNVLDAIRWVLGEQSAKALRGGEMADVIFSGTDSRAAVGMAEVSMTFADCEKDLGVEWNEVRITRRVFRDGASEYLLNKTPCRLRDIHQMFMDTGIGRSAYSIMEQGKIDLILSSKPEDRRAIFEEAAGITKFKSQRKEALRKLEATEANLLRVTDIIREVKRQIGSLQRQAGKARRYQSLIADLRTLDTHLSRRRYDELDASLAAAVAEIERLRAAHDTQSAEIEAQEGDLAGQRHGLDTLEQRLGEARQAVQELRNQISNAEHRIAMNRERGEEFAGLAERYGRDIAASEEKLAVQETQIADTDLELEQLAGTLAHEQARVDEKTVAARALTDERAAAEREAQAAGSRIAQIENKLSSLRGQISSIVQTRDGSEARMGILSAELEQAGGAAERARGQAGEMNAQLEQLGRELESARAAATEAEERLREAQLALDALEKQRAAEERVVAEKVSKLEVLRQLNEQGEGFEEGTQAVLRGLDNPEFFKSSIAGALAAHIEVEPEFIPAIEAALGENLQAILMKDAIMAESVLKTLTGKKLGKASLALGQGQRPDRRADVPEGGIARALDKVRCDDAARPLVEALLGDFVIVPDVETALRLAGNGLQFVTLAGETLSAEGILRGGQTSATPSSVLLRKAQIAQLEAEADVARTAVREVEGRLDAAREDAEAGKGTVQETREETQRLNVAVSTLRGQLSLVEREATDAAKKSETLSWERGNVEKRHAEAVARLAQLEQEIDGAGSETGDLQARRETLEKKVAELREREGEAGRELNELRIRVATERQRHDSLRNQRAPMHARMAELGDLIAQRRRDIESYDARIAQLAEDSANYEAGIAQTQVKVAEAEEQVAALVAERSALVEAVESLDSTLRILRRQLGEASEQRGQQEVRQTQVQLRIENLTEHVTRRYQIDIRDFQTDSYALVCSVREQAKRRKPSDEAEDQPAQVSGLESQVSEDEQIDWALIEEMVGELDQKIDAMGPINIDAIQEYDELEQRHQFLEQQFTDLTNSKTELLDVIHKINSTTRVMFAETFEKVRVNFQEMFTELFGGGKANLVLTDESDPLESGIDIIAKPPGKQLQSITLLSGGEKTMTAVALLFSIYMVKPSPFCVLDEMDAPLDESNINRFIKILDRFVGQSQFVVITHNKRTIAKADILYGVTMEEHGVSKLVGVRMAKREESGESSDIIGTANPTPVPSIAESFGKSGDLHSEQLQAG